MSETAVVLESPLPEPLHVLDRLARRSVLGRLSRIAHGRLVLHEGGSIRALGTRDDELRASVWVHDPRFWRSLALRGALGGAEAYLDGYWTSDDPVAVVRILARNARAREGLESFAAKLARPGLRLLHALRRNTRRGSRRNIAAHYDLGNEFYQLFLDPTLTYSSGVFESPEATLADAQHAKLDRACRALELGPDDHVLEIGTGWGSFAIHAARTTGCRVTTTTISQEQYELATRRVVEAGLADRVTVLRKDYRDLEGRFDKLASIEMIEAVGAAHVPSFLRACGERLRPGGRMFLQAIVVPEADFANSVRSVDFVKRHVFPGGQLVSIGSICAALARGTDLQITRIEDITADYAETLRRWRDAFLGALDRVRALGFDERFVRLWDFYLAYCEGGFRERANGTIQMTLVRPG